MLRACSRLYPERGPNASDSEGSEMQDDPKMVARAPDQSLEMPSDAGLPLTMISWAHNSSSDPQPLLWRR